MSANETKSKSPDPSNGPKLPSSPLPFDVINSQTKVTQDSSTSSAQSSLADDSARANVSEQGSTSSDITTRTTKTDDVFKEVSFFIIMLFSYSHFIC